MHSASFETEVTGNGGVGGGKDGGEVLVAITALVIEGRIPGKLNCTAKAKGFYEGPHCALNKSARDHKCDLKDVLCSNFASVRGQVLDLWKKSIPICVEVILSCSCNKDIDMKSDVYEDGALLEKWYFSISHRRSAEPAVFNLIQLLNAIRSQLYFSQLTAWLTVQDENTLLKITRNNLRYRLTIPGETYESTKFSISAVKHDFPPTDIGNGRTAHVSFLSLPRMSSVPNVTCQKCSIVKTSSSPSPSQLPITMTTTTMTTMAQPLAIKSEPMNILDDRMHIMCTLKGKHRCEDFDDNGSNNTNGVDHNHAIHTIKSNKPSYKRTNKFRMQCGVHQEASTSRTAKSLAVDIDKAHYLYSRHKNNLKNDDDRGKILLDAIERGGLKQQHNMKNGCCGTNDSTGRKSKNGDNRRCDLDKCVQSGLCDMSERDKISIKGKCKYDDSSNVEDPCDSPFPRLRHKRSPLHQYLLDNNRRYQTKQRLTFDDDDGVGVAIGDDCDRSGNKDQHLFVEIPTASDQAKFRKELDSAASMVFHSRTGLPLTSSPAPVRRGKSCFDFDSSINSVSAIKSALFPTVPTDDESESDGSIVSPCSPETLAALKTELSPVKYHRKGHAANLLGSFEESVLNGRLEPVSTVHGFTAELGASGSFVPKHLIVPVTVFFYTLGDNDKVSSPYLGHINLGRKGYNVPKTGTVQVTLFNPLGTVVKMFVIMYDLSDMPPNSQTFIRQRNLYMPTNCKDENAEWGPKWLRYLVHLRFISSKSGKIYLHSDIRMIIFRKSDMDTATAHGIDMSYELRSFTHMPTNPRFSPRK